MTEASVPVFRPSIYQHVLEHSNWTQLEAQQPTQGATRAIGAQCLRSAQLVETPTHKVAREFMGQHFLLKDPDEAWAPPPQAVSVSTVLGWLFVSDFHSGHERDATNISFPPLTLGTATDS